MPETYGKYGIVGKSEQILEVIWRIEQVTKIGETVFISGESGTGKELVARAIHYTGPRSRNPLYSVNCGALQESILENELFGHERGTFTGADRKVVGYFEAGNDGTIFLDELDSASGKLQADLLRVLQFGEFYRLGGRELIKTNTRIIAASSQDLDEAVAQGRFMKSLKYRLEILPIHIPPLRERREDIPLLSNHFLRIYGDKYTKPFVLSPEGEDFLKEYNFPGNVRELETIIQRSMIFYRGQKTNPEGKAILDREDLESHMHNQNGNHELPQHLKNLSYAELKAHLKGELGTESDKLIIWYNQAILRYLQQRIADFGGNVKKAAESLEIWPQQVNYLLRKSRNKLLRLP